MELIGELFDPEAELFVEDRCRPHWSQGGAFVLVTFRSGDSIPHAVFRVWDLETHDWVHRRDYVGQWEDVVPSLEISEQEAFKKEFSRCREMYLDECHGRCLLRRPELSKIVADSLMYFDRVRYRMGDFVVMPNHVHLLAAFSDRTTMFKQFESWLHYTAVQINRRLGEKGTFWQSEPFDHLVRSVEQYQYLRKYIADNPIKAKLKPGNYFYREFSPMSPFVPTNEA